MPVAAPTCPLWLASEIPAYRACDLCTHGVTVDGMRQCTRREAVQPARMRPVHLVRAPHGSCGPDAALLAFPGLDS